MSLFGKLFGKGSKEEALTTGDAIQKLREDIDNFLENRYKREFIAQVSELQQCLLYRGEFEEEFKEFLISKGF